MTHLKQLPACQENQLAILQDPSGRESSRNSCVLYAFFWLEYTSQIAVGWFGKGSQQFLFEDTVLLLAGDVASSLEAKAFWVCSTGSVRGW